MAILIFDSNGEPLKHVHQWDVDRVLAFRADDGVMPHVDVVHVGLAGHPNATEAVPMATEDDSITITLPGWQFTRTAQPLAIYFYEDMGDGEMRTVYETTLPVLRRNKPIPYSDAEYARQQAELERIANEDQRKNNELERIANENTRKAAEIERERIKAEMEAAIADTGAAIDAANAAAQDAAEAATAADAAAQAATEAAEGVQGAIDAANNAAERAEAAAEGVEAAIEAANTAATSANTAAEAANENAIAAETAADNADVKAALAEQAASAATTAATNADIATDRANAAAEAAEQAAAGITDIIDPSLTIGGKAADAEVVGLKFDEIIEEEWNFNHTIPESDWVIYRNKLLVSGTHNMVDAPDYSCLAFQAPAKGYYRVSFTEEVAQCVVWVYDSSGAYTSSTFLRSVTAAAQTPQGALINAGEHVIARGRSNTWDYSLVEYAADVITRLEPTLPLTTTQDEQMRDYIKGEFDDVLANGYQHLEGEWARGGWTSYTGTDNRAYRVRYKETVVFERDVQIVAAAGYCITGCLEDGTVISVSSVFELPKGTKAHIYLRRWDEDSSEVADIAEFAAACSISTCIADIERYSDTFTDVSMFVRMGVCGDSFAAGGGIIRHITPLTWGKNLERQAGITVDIYAKSGITVVQWITDANNGLPKLLASPECGLYWLQHGINGTSTQAEIGTPEDMSAHPRPATFYGQYVEGIEQIQAAYPNARIVLATVTGTSYSQYERGYKDANIAIRNIAAYCEVPCIEIIDDDFYKSNGYYYGMRSNHPTAMLSAGMAKANARLISRCIRDNPAYFANYGRSNYSVNGKGLSTNDYTTAEKEKLAGIEQATDTTLGLVKLNPDEGIDVNNDGQLAVDGRIGQIPAGGLYYPKTAEPTSVGAGSLLMTDGAKGLSAASRTLSIMAGANLTCRSAEAGSTEYRIVNNESNRFACAAVAVVGARIAIDVNDAATNGTAEILSVKYADGGDCIPYSGDTEADNDIIITVDRTVNPDAATTKLRVYGTAVANDVISIGQGVTGHSKGISIGQSCRTAKQQTVAAGAYVYVSDSNSFAFGKFIYIPKQFCFATGQGHDFTNANSGTSAFGQWSVIDADTAMAVGNGTNSSNRSNVFEVKNNGDIVAQGVILTSPNGTKYRLTVANDGTLITTAV